MLQTSARLLEVLRLLQGRRSWAGGELADRLEVTTRTLRRDIDKLRSIGYPIDSTSGAEGGYRLGAGSTMQPLLLEDDEAVAVALGLGSAAAGSVDGMEEASMRALSKIGQVLPERLARRVAAFQSTIVRPAGARPGVDARILATIAGACRDEQTLRFRYRDRAGAASARVVEPHRLVHTGYRWYLVAWDEDRRDWRTFRVDRIQARVTAGARFTPREPPADDLAEYVSKGVAYAPPCRARVKVHAAAEKVTQRLPPFGAGLIEPVDEATCYLELGSGCFDGLAMHLTLLGLDFEVDGPAELVEAVRRLASRLERAADLCANRRDAAAPDIA